VGTATVTNVPITVGTGSTGIKLGLAGKLTISGSAVITGDGSTGLDLGDGTVTLTGGSITTGNGSSGIAAAGTTLSLAGTSVKVGTGSFGLTESAGAVVTLAGTATSNATFTTSPTIGITDGDGVTVNDQDSTLAINGNTAISKFRTGLVVNDGTVDVTGGNVIVSNNTGDGAQFANQTPGVNYHAVLTSATFQNNKGNGVIVDSAVSTKFVTSTFTGNTGDGIQVQSIAPSGTSGFLFDVEGSSISNNLGRGIAITGLAAVGANIQSNTISGNKLSGVLVTSGAGDPTVDVAIVDNNISGNLTSATAPAGVIGGGVFFSAGAAPPTNVTLTKFVGNKVHSNTRSQVAFDFAQKGTVPWDLSSAPAVVDMTTYCQDAAKPNSVYCYSTGTGLGVAVTGSATATVKGMHFQAGNPSAGVDYSNLGVSVSLSCSAITTCP
jgi:hypothetical protein